MQILQLYQGCFWIKPLFVADLDSYSLCLPRNTSAGHQADRLTEIHYVLAKV